MQIQMSAPHTTSSRLKHPASVVDSFSSNIAVTGNVVATGSITGASVSNSDGVLAFTSAQKIPDWDETYAGGAGLNLISSQNGKGSIARIGGVVFVLFDMTFTTTGGGTVGVTIPIPTGYRSTTTSSTLNTPVTGAVINTTAAPDEIIPFNGGTYVNNEDKASLSFAVGGIISGVAQGVLTFAYTD